MQSQTKQNMLTKKETTTKLFSEILTTIDLNTFNRYSTNFKEVSSLRNLSPRSTKENLDFKQFTCLHPPFFLSLFTPAILSLLPLRKNHLYSEKQRGNIEHKGRKWYIKIITYMTIKLMTISNLQKRNLSIGLPFL